MVFAEGVCKMVCSFALKKGHQWVYCLYKYVYRFTLRYVSYIYIYYFKSVPGLASILFIFHQQLAPLIWSQPLHWPQPVNLKRRVVECNVFQVARLSKVSGWIFLLWLLFHMNVWVLYSVLASAFTEIMDPTASNWTFKATTSWFGDVFDQSWE